MCVGGWWRAPVFIFLIAWFLGSVEQIQAKRARTAIATYEVAGFSTYNTAISIGIFLLRFRLWWLRWIFTGTSPGLRLHAVLTSILDLIAIVILIKKKPTQEGQQFDLILCPQLPVSAAFLKHHKVSVKHG